MIYKGFAKLIELSAENPLNIAAAMGHVDFVKEIIRLKPVFSREVNQEGFSPMHIAADNGQVEIVKELMKVDIKLCRLEGRQKMTPFHHAAIRGRAEVVEIFLGSGSVSTGSLEVNAINHTGITALDVILLFPSEAGDREIVEILRSAGAMRA
ncbi:hypothetical protein NC653_030033 [Populus alba x Populus x berolinensis]|uniref:Uncharacterized protein n=1 Tax=Populus alba x Populus x berolinensis TaxID=444605 RepID=A0AAD6M3X8_9ROSI|nr:hypothetical protein NC653_030033 [Populus alba x Populus x berolinensis]